jgi:hypothetical protein
MGTMRTPVRHRCVIETTAAQARNVPLDGIGPCSGHTNCVLTSRPPPRVSCPGTFVSWRGFSQMGQSGV